MFLQVLTWKVIQMHNEWLFSWFFSMLWFCSRPTKGVLYAHWIGTRHTLLCTLAFTSCACLKRQSQWNKGCPSFSLLGRKWHSTTKRSLLTLASLFFNSTGSSQVVNAPSFLMGPKGKLRTDHWWILQGLLSLSHRDNQHLRQLRTRIGSKSGYIWYIQVHFWFEQPGVWHYSLNLLWN